MTFIATLRSDEIDARHVLEGPIGRATFSPWVDQSLTSTLKPALIARTIELCRSA